jgi:DNA-binding protein HU-beta
LTNIKHKETVALIAKHSDLYQYQVEDCLNSLAVTLSHKLSEGLSVQVKGVGSFNPKQRASRVVKSHLKGVQVEYKVPEDVVVKFKPDSMLRNKVNQVKE